VTAAIFAIHAPISSLSTKQHFRYYSEWSNILYTCLFHKNKFCIKKRNLNFSILNTK